MEELQMGLKGCDSRHQIYSLWQWATKLKRLAKVNDFTGRNP